jgi:regulation of enolase protein 1 (concanavalin A-like superfamily)
MNKKIYIYSIVTLAFVIAAPVLSAQSKQKSLTNSASIKAISPDTFKHRDIGNPAITGTVNILTDGVDITAGGADIWGSKDEFNFVYIERSGDFDLAARIESLTAANLYTKAGLMAREEMTPGSRHIFFQVFPNNNPRNNNNGGFEFQYRQVKDSLMKAVYPKSSAGTPEFPVAYPDTWIRLQRIGNKFTGFYSTDGKSWKAYTTYTLVLPLKIYLGLAVTSHEPAKPASAKFRNIEEFKL